MFQYLIKYSSINNLKINPDYQSIVKIHDLFTLIKDLFRTTVDTYYNGLLSYKIFVIREIKYGVIEMVTSTRLRK